MPEAVTEGAVMTALSLVEDPELHRDIVSLNMVRNLNVAGDTVSVTLMLTTPACPLTGPFKEAVETALLAIPGVTTANVALDAEVRGHKGSSDRKPVNGVKNRWLRAMGPPGIKKRFFAKRCGTRRGYK